MANYKLLRDEELVLMAKQGDDIAEVELVKRYKPRSTRLSRAIYHKFKKSTFLGVEDLFNSGLYALFIAIKDFKYGNFEAYWIVIAKHEMLNQIKESSDSYNISKKFQVSANVEEIGIFDKQEEHPPLKEEIINFLKKGKNKLPNDYIEVFAMYLDGFSIKDIAKNFGQSYHQIRYKIELVKAKLEKFYIHS